MHRHHSNSSRFGMVLSDLHLFARRSRAADCLESVRADMACADVIVLNGDTFDFRWSTLPDRRTTIAASRDWLRAFVHNLPRCQLHFVLGNHDCLTDFRMELQSLVEELPRLHWHEHWLRLGPALFLHGDCAQRWMDAHELRRYRAVWEKDGQRGRIFSQAYLAADRLGLTRLVHRRQFPQAQTVQRVAHYLDAAWPEWRGSVRDCYFGHTHLAFSGCEHQGVAFHNSGSAIRGLTFRPIRFDITEAMRKACQRIREESRGVAGESPIGISSETKVV
ncbi:MAG: metallophosphoesterase [Verrucomicrobiota bacterium]